MIRKTWTGRRHSEQVQGAFALAAPSPALPPSVGAVCLPIVGNIDPDSAGILCMGDTVLSTSATS